MKINEVKRPEDADEFEWENIFGNIDTDGIGIDAANGYLVLYTNDDRMYYADNETNRKALIDSAKELIERWKRDYNR